MKTPIKISKAKKEICKKCKLKKACGDLPGFCALIYYVPIAVVVIMLAFFLLTMKL